MDKKCAFNQLDIRFTRLLGRGLWQVFYRGLSLRSVHARLQDASDFERDPRP